GESTEMGETGDWALTGESTLWGEAGDWADTGDTGLAGDIGLTVCRLAVAVSSESNGECLVWCRSPNETPGIDGEVVEVVTSVISVRSFRLIGSTSLAPSPGAAAA